MAIRHWHRPKIVLLWVSYFIVVLISWAVTVRINQFRVDLLSTELALIWLLLFIPLFIVTWKWASGREQEEQLKKNGISPPVKQEESTTLRQDGMEREYRIRTLEISRYDLDHGRELHPGDFVKMNEEFQGWRLLSVCPLEKACNEVDERAKERITILALIEHPAVEKHYSGPTLVWRPDPS
jgi:hypothetical protein